MAASLGMKRTAVTPPETMRTLQTRALSAAKITRGVIGRHQPTVRAPFVLRSSVLTRHQAASPGTRRHGGSDGVTRNGT